AINQATEERTRHILPGMPARSAAESVARMHAERGDTTELLAMYRTMGRLDMVEHPERAAVERASQQPGSLIIAQDQAQRDRLLNLLDERSDAQSGQDRDRPDQEPQTRPQAPQSTQERPNVLLAQDAYRERAERRARWIEQTRETARAQGRETGAFQHHVEPGAIDTALVLVNDPKDAPSLSHGLSGAAEAHLVTGPPDWLTGEAVRLRADQLTVQQHARAQLEGERQGVETQREMAERSHEAERGAERQRSGAEHEAQHQGAER
nr:hypothetical protein [Candidatus Dormibacteraeota bacterium]